MLDFWFKAMIVASLGGAVFTSKDSTAIRYGIIAVAFTILLRF